MSEFLIDLPYHKRWYLPDGKHMINSVIYGNQMRCSIIRTSDYRITHEYTINVFEDGWEDLWVGYQEKAKKAFPKELRHKSRSVTHTREKSYD